MKCVQIEAGLSGAIGQQVCDSNMHADANVVLVLVLVGG